MKINNGSEKILLVDYQPKWVALVRQVLELEGYPLVVENQIEKALHVTALELPEMVLLEPFQPGNKHAFDIVRHIRLFSDMPIIILSSHSDQETVLRAFDTGVDDYITKPFDPKILVARVRAVFNRINRTPPLPQEIKCANLIINLTAHKVFLDGNEIILTETEYKLLLELARNKNKILLHEQLLGAVWGTEFKNELMYLRSFIHTLRRKIEQDPSNPKIIINRSGFGYMLVTGCS